MPVAFTLACPGGVECRDGSSRVGSGRKTLSARRAPRPENRPTIPASLEEGEVGGRVIPGECGNGDGGGESGAPCT